MGRSGGFVFPDDSMICCEGERKEKNEKVMDFFFFFLTVGFLFFHMSHIYLKMEEIWRYSNWR